MTAPDLGAFELWKISSVPRRSAYDTPRDPSAITTDSSVRMALVATYADLVERATDRPTPAVATIWLRDAGNQVRFVCGGRPSFTQAQPADDGSDTAVLFPLGARGHRADADAITRQLREFPSWVAVEGQYAPDDERSMPVQPTVSRLEDCIAHMSGAQCAVVIIAHPLDHSDIDRQLQAVERQMPAIRAQGSVERDRLRTRRSEQRYKELSNGHATGMWSLQVLIGAPSRGAATSLAAMACNTSDVTSTSYALRPVNTPTASRPVPAGHDAVDQWRSPVIASVDLLAAVARPPQRELPGIRLQSRHTFDLTPEPVRPAVGDGAHTPQREVTLGTVVDESLSAAGAFPVSFDTLNRHTFVCGATGSGKSQTVRALLERASEQDLRWLVIEPAKAEYARMAGRLDKRPDGPPVWVIRPGDPSLAPASLNPLEPEPGFPLQSHLDLVRALFLAAFDTDEPFPQVLAHALISTYDAAGWDVSIGRPKQAAGLSDEQQAETHPTYPVLRNLQAAAHQVITEIGYGREVTDNVQGFVDVRLSSLRLGASGRFFEGGHPIDVGVLMRRNTVLEIEGITNDQDKAFLIGAVLIRMIEYLRVHHGRHEHGVDLHHLTVIEEAHRLLRNAQDGPRAQAVEIFSSLLAEIRAYGEGIIVAEQIPSKILPDVVKNSALKVMHRLPAKDDRDVVGATMNLQPEQSEYVVGVPPGVAAVATDGMDRPILVRMPGDPGMRESAARARLDPPLLGRRSELCGAACQARPCTGREARAGEVAADDPILTLWIESVVAAHVMGMHSPAPTAGYVDELRRHERRLVECALSFAIDRSVDARRGGLSHDVDPDAFRQHIRAFVEHHVFDSSPACDADETRWQAGHHRWNDVISALKQAMQNRDVDLDRPHPATQRWLERGLDLRGLAVPRQLERLNAHPSRALDDVEGAIGDAERSGLRTALRRLNGRAGGVVSDPALVRRIDGVDAGWLFATFVDVAGRADASASN